MDDWRDAMKALIPDHMWGAVERYIDKGISPGSFVGAVFSNDLLHACQAADIINKRNIAAWGEFMLYVPMGCFGSRELVRAWCNGGGIEGMRKE